MDAKNLVGVGNIYAVESLFKAGIRPQRLASKLRLPDYQILVAKIRETLTESIKAGGTTFRDYRGMTDQSGAFQQQLFVYASGGEPCLRCQTPIKKVVLAGRSSFYCIRCQV